MLRTLLEATRAPRPALEAEGREAGRAARRLSRPSPTDAGLAALRVFAGLSLSLAHGLGKLPPSDAFVAGVAEMGFPVPRLFAWAAAFSESLGGVLLALGIFTRPAALFILATMLVAGFVKQAGDPFLERELAFLYAAVAALFLLAGPGRVALAEVRRTGADCAAPRRP